MSLLQIFRQGYFFNKDIFSRKLKHSSCIYMKLDLCKFLQSQLLESYLMLGRWSKIRKVNQADLIIRKLLAEDISINFSASSYGR